MKKTLSLLSLLLLFTLVLNACSPATPTASPTSTPLDNQSLINTAVAVSVASLSTEVASLKATAAAPTATTEPTRSSGTPAPAGGTPTPSVHSAGLCDYAAFVGDITIPDGTMIPPNSPFTKTWAIKNTGSCTWTPEYTLVFSGGEPMGSPLSVPLTNTNIAPGQTAHISIKFTAPPDDKLHDSFWKFRNPKGGVFGVIDATNKETPIWAQIRSGNTYSYIDNMCMASWKTGGGRNLPCPGNPSDTDGTVYRMSNSQWDNGDVENDPVLVMVPPAGQNTTIIGQFPPVVVPPNSNLTTRIGCLKESTNCNFHLKITYSVDGGPELPLYEIDHAYGYDPDKVNINENKFQLANQSASFIFYVTAVGDGADNKVFLFVPKLAP
jgi:hypothetical protein